jgi:hypothetical protein
MSLFVVQHSHPAERCPAKDPQMGQMLLKHLAPENAARFGVTVTSDAVVDGEHTFYMIVEAEDQNRLEQFMAPFAQAGSVRVQPASHCGEVVGRLGC